MATLVETAGNRWRVVTTLGPPHEHADWHDYPYRAEDEHGAYRLDDVNGDGVPEVVGHSRYAGYVARNRHAPKHYVVYKLIGRRFVKVWYSKAETPEAILGRLNVALGLGNELMLENICESPAVAERVRAFPIWKKGLSFDSAQLTRNGDGTCTATNRWEPKYRIDMIRLSEYRWRISGIERVEPEQGEGDER